MPAKRDYYEVLGVSKSADPAEVKRAYRKKAMQFHPDRNPGDQEAEERFKEAAEAFEVLSDDHKRGLYDQFGHDGPSRAGFSGFSGTDEIFAHFGDLFGDLFSNLGFGGGRRGVARGGDIKVELPLTLQDVLDGGDHDILVPRRERCGDCGGTGSAEGSAPESCRQCGGHGQVVHRQGFFTLQTTCPVCRGEGKMITNPCRGCSGQGVVQQEADLTVTVPAGVDNGQTLRIQGRGQPGSGGGPPGNLYVFVRVEDDPRFVRDEFDVHSKVDVSMLQATLGCKLEIDTLDGTEEIEIEAGTQPAEVITRRGRGIPVLGGRGRGDHLVHVVVNVPRKLSSSQEEALRALAEDMGDAVEPAKKGFLDGLRRRLDRD